MTGRRIATLVVASLVGFQAAAQLSRMIVQAELSHMGDTAHLEFRGLKNWRYDLQKDGAKKIVLTVPALDQASVARLQAFSDSMISSVTVDKTGADGTYVLAFALASDQVESFDYLTDDPSRLIVDFYHRPVAEQKPKTAAKTAQSAAKKKSTFKGKTAAHSAPDKASRKPAGDEFLAVEDTKKEQSDVSMRFGVFDAGDENYDRFRVKDYEVRDEAIIASRQNIYLPFPMLKMKVSQLDKLMEDQPEYVIHPKDTRENKEARLLLTLFERKRYAVFLKTYDYFAGKYPDSEYNEILKNLAAHVYLSRWRKTNSSNDFEQARALYSQLIQKFPGSPLREYNYLTLGYAEMEHGEALSTLQTFEGFLKSYPTSQEAPQIHKALAEADMILHKYDDALEQYQKIIHDFPKSTHAQEARYRLGDVYFAKGDYGKAIQTYETAIKELPSQEKIYPNANFNMAEARFWQKDYKKSLNNYVQFVNLFPSHDHGGYALTRIGELLGILGADPRRVMGAFLESYFRFPDHPGAQVARIRMLSQQMRTMKPNELKHALDEINQISTKVDIAGIKQFGTLMVAEGLSNRGEYKEALEYLIGYYQKNPSAANMDVFKARIMRNIASELKDEVDRGEFMKALDFHSKYATTWLKNSDRIDVPFFLGGAFEKAGDYPEAQKIYREALAHRTALVGTQIEKEKKVQEYLPSVDSLHLRLAATMMQERKYREAYQEIKAIGAGKDLSDVETIERVELSAEIAEQRNDTTRAREALLDLAKRWQGDPALVAPVNLKLAQNFMKMGDAKQAEYHAGKVLEAEGGETKVADKVIAGALTVKADALLQQKKALSAVETYQKLLERFEDKMPLASVRYKVGQILFDRGDIKGASDVWKRLEGTPNEFLYKIGQEKIDDTKWRDEYNKYIDRIPAMAGDKAKRSKQ